MLYLGCHELNSAASLAANKSLALEFCFKHMIISSMKEDNKNIFLPQILHVQYKSKLVDWLLCLQKIKMDEHMLPLYHFFFKKRFFACNLIWILSWIYDYRDFIEFACQESEKEDALTGNSSAYSFGSSALCTIEQSLLLSTWKLPNSYDFNLKHA